MNLPRNANSGRIAFVRDELRSFREDVCRASEAASLFQAPIGVDLKAKLDRLLRGFFSSTAVDFRSVLCFPKCTYVRTERLDPQRRDCGSGTPSDQNRVAEPWTGKSRANAGELAQYLANGYRLLQSRAEDRPSVPIEILPFDRCRNKVHVPLRKLIEALEPMAPFLLGAYVHGSYGIGDAVTGYSDLDAALLLKKETCINKDGLMEARKAYLRLIPELYAFDYQQHHEFFVLTEWDLRFPDANYYPRLLWEEARVLVGEGALRVSFSDNSLMPPAKSLIAVIESVLSFIATPKWSRWYYTKALLSHLALLPSLFYQFHGREVSKASALERIQSEFYWADFLRKTTAVRAEWTLRSDCRFPREAYRHCLHANPQVVRVLFSMRRKTPKWIFDILQDSFAEEALDFLAALLRCHLDVD